MPRSLMVRPAALAAAISIAVASPASAALGPNQQIGDESGDDIVVTDMDGRGSRLVASFDATPDEAEPYVVYAYTTDGGAAWSFSTFAGFIAGSSRVALCGSIAMSALVVREDAGRRILLEQWDVTAPPAASSVPVTTTGAHRSPDIACLPGGRTAIAYATNEDGAWLVRLLAGDLDGSPGSSQLFEVGPGAPGKGLAVASTDSRVFVAWFAGHRLRLARFRIAGSSPYRLTRIDTTTIATLPTGATPQLAAHGSRVVLAYRDKGDLKVRRSNDHGARFGSARTLRATPSGTDATPTSVSVRGDRVAIGAIEIHGTTAMGLGYASADAGSSYTRIASRSGGRIVATLFQPGNAVRYAQIADQSISDPPADRILFRRE